MLSRSTLGMALAISLAGGIANCHAQQSDLNDPKLLTYRGQLLLGKGELKKAMKDFEKAIELSPKYALAIEGRATAWLYLEEWDKAIRDFTEVIRLDPKRDSAFGNRGVAWKMKGDLGKAMTDYSEAIRLNPRHSQAYHNRGMIWAEREDWDKAIKDNSKAIRINPKYEEALISRGNAWNGLGMYEKALNDYDEVIRLNPKSSMARYNRASLRATCPDEKIRDGKKAVEDAKKAYDLSGEKRIQNFEIVAAAYAEAGQFDEAIKWQKKALKMTMEAELDAKSVSERLQLYEMKKPYREHRSGIAPRP